jgi:hypothetical protein
MTLSTLVFLSGHSRISISAFPLIRSALDDLTLCVFLSTFQDPNSRKNIGSVMYDVKKSCALHGAKL